MGDPVLCQEGLPNCHESFARPYGLKTILEYLALFSFVLYVAFKVERTNENYGEAYVLDWVTDGFHECQQMTLYGKIKTVKKLCIYDIKPQ
jgi:hypothetical protein